MILRLILALMLTFAGRVLCAPLNMACCAPAEEKAVSHGCCSHSNEIPAPSRLPSHECSCEFKAPTTAPQVEWAAPHVELPLMNFAITYPVLCSSHRILNVSSYHGPPFPLPRLISLRI